ncbi:GUN4 domain-containing protein [Nodosilinea sp. E11]|uniref:GUN4 domain-containing protein n=1 Tax=Nodosilinea sp. E11 TaxID=3037479 RepID=UPI0029349BEF|nr:GUN4 domain-containing protein [Nodosilinea sp. E11]WOD38433.1 GUN4 domain-containing protein [Nodosilinea sp. E11]
MLASEPIGSLDATLNDLSLLLNDEDWEMADRLTADLLLEAVMQNALGEEVLLRGRDARQRPHLTPQTLATIPCQLLQAIDDRWQSASGGHFGFSPQLQIYSEILKFEPFDPALHNWSNPHPFFAEVGWLMLFSLRPVGFLRFYNWLDFDLEAPQGHLPALWYWQVPRLASLRMGGFLTGQGAGFGDLSRLDAMMLRLSRCHQAEGMG